MVIRGQLPPDGKLGRLVVVASENGAQFSPYVLNVADMMVANGQPLMLSPLALRLVSVHAPDRKLSFVSDIDGYVRVMQDVDTADEPKAVVKLTCKINPNLGWAAWLKRKTTSWLMSPRLS